MAGRVLLSTTEPDAAGVRELVGVAGAVPQEATSSLPTSSQMTSSMEVVTDEVGDEPTGALAALRSVSPSHVMCSSLTACSAFAPSQHRPWPLSSDDVDVRKWLACRLAAC